MDSTNFEKYLKERYEDQMNWYDKKAGVFQKKYKQWTVIVIVLSAITPVLAAIDFAGDFSWMNKVVKVVLITISAIVAIGTTILKTFRYQELYTTYRESNERLKTEKYLFDARLGVYSQPNVDLQAIFVEQVESILTKEHTKWVSSNQAVPPVPKDDVQKEAEQQDKENNPPPAG